ncbi:MAG TPA: TonB-dependent receptor [Vicinamibacterales bacterium]
MTTARATIALLFAIQSLGGLRLEDAISILERQGLTVVYSSALVKPEMRVEREPRASTPRGKLEEILAPLGLRLVEGPRHELLVVAGPKPAPRVEPAPPPAPKPRYSDEIVVKPAPKPATSGTPTQVESISGDELRRVSDPSGDLTRTMQRFPGITGTEASAAIGIRGGTPDQTIIAVDGLELSEPFHLRNFFNLFSTLDSSSVSHVDLMSGAFPAEWGDRIGGVINLDLLSSAPQESESSSLSLGTLNSRLTTLGTTPDRNTSWIFTTRGWYPDAILNFDKSSSELISTDCYDVLGKVEHRFSPRTTASISFLSAYDDLAYRNFGNTAVDRSAAHERSSHFWLTGRTEWSDSVSMRSILAVGRLFQDRVGSIVGNDALQIADSRGFNFVELKQDWSVAARGSQIKFGLDARTSDARYDYTRTATGTPLIDVHLRPHEQAASVYASDSIPLGAHAVAEVGLRWDRQSLRGGDAQLSPRVNLLWTIDPDTNVRLGWGRYYQSQRLNELQVEDGVTQFAAPELAEHRNVSFDHRFERGLTLSVTAFDDPVMNVRQRFENVLNPIDVFPEAQLDRVLVAPLSSRARGVEMRMTGRAGERIGWWASYTLSRATDRIDGRDVPRSWDQPRAASGGFNVDLQRDWSASLTGTYHSGWPTTPVVAVANTAGASLVLGERNSERLPTFFRLDARVAKSLHVTRGELLLTFDVVNLTNHNNVCCISDVSAFDRGDGTFGVHREDRSLIPFFPLLSARWKF